MDNTHVILGALLAISIAVAIGGFAYLAYILHLMRTSVTPGEAAIYLEMRRVLEEYKP